MMPKNIKLWLDFRHFSVCVCVVLGFCPFCRFWPLGLLVFGAVWLLNENVKWMKNVHQHFNVISLVLFTPDGTEIAALPET